MIASIIDIVASRDATVRERRKLDREIRGVIDETYKRFKEYCLAMPALTQGDSIEMLVSSWQPIVYLLHKLLMDGFKVRVGLGTGEIIIHNEKADDCDGPVFWNAREALDEVKGMNYKRRSASFKIDENASDRESAIVISVVLFFANLLSLSTTQLQYCFYYLWEMKQISEIAKAVKTTKGNVSRTLSKTPCYLLKEVMTFLDW
ncbi:MAG: SatD family protein [Candidatus Thorarchaeota archaeon]